MSNSKKIVVEFTNERIIPASGLAVVGAILGKSDFVKQLNRMDVTKNRSQHQIKNGDILLTYIGQLCMGKPDFHSVCEFSDDPEFYKLALGITRAIPSEETLRQRMDDIGSSLRKEILDANIAMLKANGIVPSRMPNGYVPVDIDVTPFDNSKSKKQGVSRTYKGYDGYAPIMAYIGTEGYLINCELREGKQHCQNGTPGFLRETLALCRQLTDAPLLIRLDSGNDSADNIGILLEHGCYFIIKRNLRRESQEGWFDDAKQHCQNISTPREGKNVYIGSTWKDVTYTGSDDHDYTIGIRAGYEIIERSMDKYGQFLMPSDIEINTWWTNLGLSDTDIINLYHAHGECEQFHSEIKTDMDVERLPSGKFDTNELVMELTVLAYNILRMIGQESLGKKDAPMEHERWVWEHQSMGWHCDDFYEHVPVPRGICEQAYRTALREQTRCHAMAMDGELTKEKILRHYRDCLSESEKDKDFEPFNCMLRLIRRFDGLRIYRFSIDHSRE